MVVKHKVHELIVPLQDVKCFLDSSSVPRYSVDFSVSEDALPFMHGQSQHDGAKLLLPVAALCNIAEESGTLNLSCRKRICGKLHIQSAVCAVIASFP